jgi:hypothetical protein
MVVAINQPCYLPWRGFFALMRLADTFVFYDDVQFTSNTAKSFFSRVQLKTEHGRRWLTVPVRKAGRFGQLIKEAAILPDARWQRQHCEMTRRALRDAPFAEAVEPILRLISGTEWALLADLNLSTTRCIAETLGIRPELRVSSELGIAGSGSQRVLDICRKLGATKYVTGHGAVNYLRHEDFEAAGIAVEYIDYSLAPYPQLHGAFDPYVTVLDVIANTGPEAPAQVQGATIPWRVMVSRHGGAR